ncbi:hypothetical protein NQ315_017257 [Exocentrus adspersus]|uniref:DNA replication complex GINS protein PSF2 n=1 Tax=Exocentrus adspersus TaxID=1586481 RepID=A0AAV8VFR0_9CUCU|nr:hypothetical protein NQ315_017257 [Exocentrus adspersus]
MDPDEVEFLGEKQYVTIIPTFNSGVIHLISGDVGPFRASLPVRTPLWMAINLKQQQKCKIQQPDWMDVERLESIREDEKLSRTFTKMPNEHYMVIAKLLLGCASDDIPRADEIRTIIKDIWDIRMSKIRSSVDALVKNAGSYAAVDNLTVMEINSIRPILPHALDQLHRIKASRKRPGTQSLGTTTFVSSSNNRSSFPSTSFIS